MATMLSPEQDCAGKSKAPWVNLNKKPITEDGFLLAFINIVFLQEGCRILQNYGSYVKAAFYDL